MKHILLEVSRILNQHFNTTPLLYGSYALQEALNKDYQARDIDLLIENQVLKNRVELIKVFVLEGFTYYHTKVLTFEKDGIEIEISNLEEWIKNANFIMQENFLVQENESKYSLLSASNLERLYQFLLTDQRRSNEKKLRDQAKLNDLKVFLER
jgi:hypothetical protein